jgi:3-oxoacyl-[acyl-carrier protein] reductase
LRDQVAVVTGSTRGIGHAIAHQLARHGAGVVVNGVDEVAVRATAEALHGDTIAIAGDITSPDITDALVHQAIKRWGRLDIVVNNAGYNWDSPLAEMTDEQFQAMLDIHVMAPFRLLRAAAPFLLDQPAPSPGVDAHHRKVINISSVAGTMGNPDQANYNAAKAALIGLTKGLAKEWGPRRVNVNAVAPGFIDTRLTASDETGESITRGGRTIPLGIPDSRRRQGVERVALGRPGTPREVARTVLFLSSPWSNYVHGQVISVTGGLQLGMES